MKALILFLSFMTIFSSLNADSQNEEDLRDLLRQFENTQNLLATYVLSPVLACFEADLKTNEVKQDTEVIDFYNNISLKITMPEIKCPLEFLGKKICYENKEGMGTIVLDPGHDLSSSSLRNGFHDEVHEGQGNMVMALLTRKILLACAPYNDSDKSGLKQDMIVLSHYPGEINYGDYTAGGLPQSLKKGANKQKISEKGGNALFNHVNWLLGLDNKGKKTVISIHQDAPDLKSDKARYDNDYPAVYFRKNRKNSAELARLTYENLVKFTKGFYKPDQVKKFDIVVKEGKKNYPKLFLDDFENDNTHELKINGKPVVLVATDKDRAQIMRAGVKPKDFASTTYALDRLLSKFEKNKQLQEYFQMDDLKSSVERTEVVLAEGFFMDGKIAGASVQRELSDYVYDEKMNPKKDKKGRVVKKRKNDEAPKIRFSYRVKPTKGSANWTPINFEKAGIKVIPSKGQTQKYTVEKVGERDHLRISSLHMASAKAYAMSLFERHACP